MDSEDSQQSSAHPDSPVDATAREDNPEAMDRSGSDSRSSSDSGSDGEADPDTRAENHEEENKSVADQDETSNVSDRNSNTNPDENESRHSGGGSDNDREGAENEGGRRRRSKTQENGDTGDTAVELSHEDLSDVSDLDSSNSGDEQRERKNGQKRANRSSLQSNGTANDEDQNSADGDGDTMTNHTDSAADAAGGQKSPIVAPPVCDLRQKLNAKKKATGESPTKGNSISIDDDLKKTDEDELDFEAEDGECNDEPEEAKSATEGKVRRVFVIAIRLLGLLMICHHFLLSIHTATEESGR